MPVSVEPKTCKVALLAGGDSGEREVSLASGEGARSALESAGFPVTMLDPAKKEDLKTLIDGDFDIAFICLHGRHGEDGAIQGFLEVAGIPYIGSKIWSSALAMDKAMAKVFYEEAGICTPKTIVLTKPHEKSATELFAYVGTPCVVKPNSEGSTLGVFIVDDEDGLTRAIETAFTMDSEVLVEQFIKGRELTVAVLGSKEPYALPVIEIIPIHEFYDYESKYTPGGSKHLCPAPLDDVCTEEVTEMAIKAHQVLKCEGVSRSDFILDADNTLWILETNTIPGMTETSLLPDAGRAAGLDFSQLCTLLVEYALETSENKR